MSLQLADEFTTSGWVYNYPMSLQLADEFTTTGGVYNKRMSGELPDEFTTSGCKCRMRSFSAFLKKYSLIYFTL